MQGFLSRLKALIRKETRQMLRDRSNLAVGLALPLALILLFGYGLSFDVKNAPIAVVQEDHSVIARNAIAGLQGSPYLAPIWVGDMPTAEQKMRAGEFDAIVRVPIDFSRRFSNGQAQIQLILNGGDSSTASAIEGYVAGALATYAQHQVDRSGNKISNSGGITIVQRMWFNEASNSSWYLVPGLIALVMTLIGAFLTSLLIAREWERGTFESLFVTPVRPFELMLAKLAPYIVVGAIDLGMCLLAAHFLFEVPMRGSLLVVVLASMLYLGVSLLLGLLISGRTRNQFEASQLALLVSFMPAMMLSGLVFDVRNMPTAVQVVSQILPATHFMGLIKTLFLAGNDWSTIVEKSLILVLYIVVLGVATTRTLRKKLD
ncbi:ABC transporter permease [Herbaspirillum robiniae]|uniref:ABC transporter permease n=1 Tax=Herbaspirillum robiniae TaxID=2014887 RepID=UPI003D770F51